MFLSAYIHPAAAAAGLHRLGRQAGVQQKVHVHIFLLMIRKQPDLVPCL